MKKKASKKAKILKKARSTSSKKKPVSKKPSPMKKKASSSTKKTSTKKSSARANLKSKPKKTLKKTKLSAKKSSKKSLSVKKTSSLNKKKSAASTKPKTAPIKKHSKKSIKTSSKLPYSKKNLSKKLTAKSLTSKEPVLKKAAIKLKTPVSHSQRKGNQKLSKSEEMTINHIKEELQKIEERKQEKNLILKDMEGRDYCLFEDCDFPAVSGEYCRLHYIGRWDYIRIREKLIKTEFIEKKIQEALKKSSSACITYLIGDLHSEKNFLTRIKPLLEDIDNLNEEDLFVKETGIKDGHSEKKI